MPIPSHTASTFFRVPRSACAFTLMEMMVAISILVVVILSVGVIFKSASTAVGLSQSSLEMLSNVRGIQQQIERDVAGLDKNAFLVIRCSTFTDATVTPHVVRRDDQISFIANGAFHNRTGTTNASAFTDTNTMSPTAFVWWGQLALEKSGVAPASSGSELIPTKYLSNTAVTTKIPLDQVPTGIKDSDFILGRHTTLLVPLDILSGTNTSTPSGIAVPSFPSDTTVTPPIAAIDYNNTNNVKALSEPPSCITESRISVAQLTSSQLISYLMQTLTATRTNLRFEADHYCYRYGALTSPYDGAGGSFVDGYFRMHPIALQGVSSFAIDWTDGSVYTGAVTDVDLTTGAAIAAGSSLIGTTKWYGLSTDGTTGVVKNNTYSPNWVDHVHSGSPVSPSNGDLYTAIFSTDNPHQGTANEWPIALRFRYHVADPTGRIPNGRDFVQVVKLLN